MGQENLVSCVLTLDKTLSSTEMIQITEVVAAGCNGALFLLVQQHG